MKKIVFIFCTIYFLFTPYASGNDNKFSVDIKYFKSYIEKKLTEVATFKEKIDSNTITYTEKEKITKYVYYNLDVAFLFINNPANKEYLNYANKYFVPLLPSDVKEVVEKFFEIAQLQISTEEKIKLFFETQGSACDAIYNAGLQVANFGLYLLEIGGFLLLTIILQLVAVPFAVGGLFIGLIGLWIMMLGSLCKLVFG